MIALAVELAGIALLAAGLAMLAPWLGVAVLGALLILLGISLERGEYGTRGPVLDAPE